MKTSSLLVGILPLATGAFAGVVEVIQARQSNWTVGQTVETTSGRVSGHAAKNASASEVSEYLGIPFGKAPIGDLRFAAPVKFEGTGALNGSVFGNSCPVQSSSGSGLPTTQALDFANVTSAGIPTFLLLGNGAGKYDEDCLNLNVWTKPQVGEAKKAVLVWLYGGGFRSGSSASAAFNGANLVEEQDVIVVSLNYRLSILGFPGNPNGTENLGLLDQRLAVEWVRDNIEKFGGDPARIILFGQSAGGASVDLYAYAWADDPILAGIIPESGNTYGWALPNSKVRSASFWFNVTETLDCGDATSDPKEVLTCMRSKNATQVLDAIPRLSGTDSILGGFGPTADEKVVYTDFKDRTPAKIPMLIGNNHYEAGLFRVQFALRNETLPDKFWDALNLQSFTCPTGLRANASIADDIPVWRYRYFGIFPNLRISDDAGAWHTAEVPMIFNTAPNSIPATTEQIRIGKYMRGAWAAFAKDPTNGLTTYGWPRYDPSQDTLVRLAYENLTGPNLINPRRYDADCVFVNVSSTDSNVEIPDLPDLGASITPTGASTPSQTAGPSSSVTGSAPSGTTTPSLGLRLDSNVLATLAVVLMAFYL